MTLPFWPMGQPKSDSPPPPPPPSTDDLSDEARIVQEWEALSVDEDTLRAYVEGFKSRLEDLSPMSPWELLDHTHDMYLNTSMPVGEMADALSKCRRTEVCWTTENSAASLECRLVTWSEDDETVALGFYLKGKGCKPMKIVVSETHNSVFLDKKAAKLYKLGQGEDDSTE